MRSLSMEDSSTACFDGHARSLNMSDHCSALHGAGLGHLVPSVGRAITERVRSRGCSQIDRWLHHPLLHDQIVLVTSPIIC